MFPTLEGADMEKAVLEIPLMYLTLNGQKIEFKDVKMKLNGEVISYGSAKGAV